MSASVYSLEERQIRERAVREAEQALAQAQKQLTNTQGELKDFNRRREETLCKGCGHPRREHRYFGRGGYPCLMYPAVT